MITKEEIKEEIKKADAIEFITSIEDIPLTGLALKLADKHLMTNGVYGYQDAETGKKTLLFSVPSDSLLLGLDELKAKKDLLLSY